MPSDKNVVCVRLDSEYLYKLEKLAESKGLDRSKFLRMLIVQYLDNQPSSESGISSELSSKIEALLNQAKQEMDIVINKWIKYCEDSANGTHERNQNLDLTELKRDCLKRFRPLIVLDLKQIADKTMEEIKRYDINSNLKLEYTRKLYLIRDQCLLKTEF